MDNAGIMQLVSRVWFAALVCMKLLSPKSHPHAAINVSKFDLQEVFYRYKSII